MTATAPTFTCEAAISSVDYDSRALLRIEERLRARLGLKAASQDLWTTAERTSVGGRPAGEMLESDARLVVLLHQRMWGRTPETLEDRAAIERRIAANGTDFLRIVQLDRTPLPAWLRKAPSCSLVDSGLDACIGRIVENAGARSRGAAPAGADVTARMTADAQAARERDAFLGSARAHSALNHELERLSDEVVRRLVAVGYRIAALGAPGAARVPAPGQSVDVRRSPGRCTVQLGRVALSFSWIRSRSDTAAEGRLMIIEWEGTIGRPGVPGDVVPATAVWEHELRADATRADDWLWRSDAAPVCGYSSRDLAAMCVDSLVHAAKAEL